MITRRTFIAGAGLAMPALAAASAQGSRQSANPAVEPQRHILRATPLPPTGNAGPALWAFGAIPGPVLRARRDKEFWATIQNDLPQPIAVHWHGVRRPADVAAPLSAVPAGTSQEVRFTPRDAGTFWYRSTLRGGAHQHLYGLLLVEEPAPADIDRDIALVLDRKPGGAGGEQFTVNGQMAVDLAVRSNERLRLRLLNASPATLLALRFEQHRPTVIAIDGQPAEPYSVKGDRITLGPGNRIDLSLDAALAPGSSALIWVETPGAAPAAIGGLRYETGSSARAKPHDQLAPLPANPLPSRIELSRALRIDLPLDPAATTGGAGQRGKNAQSARPIWTTPKLGAGMAPFAPLFSIPAGRPVVLAFSNSSTTPYSAHVHGHAFRLLDALDDGWKPFWLDTLVVPPQKTERIAFVAETRGRYLIQSQALAAAGPELATAFDIA